MSLTSPVYTYFHAGMLAQVYVLLLTSFIYLKYLFNKCLELKLLCVLSNDIQYTQVIQSICTCIAVVDYTCIKSAREFKKNIRLK